MNKPNTWKKAGLVCAASVCLALTAAGQSADALIDKLVEKGILTVKEANELREEADKNFSQAYSVKSGMSDWVSALKFNGDLRLRYDHINVDNPSVVDRDRARYRLRFGVTAVLQDNFEVGLRLISGETGRGSTMIDPISGNASAENNAAKKLLGIDLAYARWTPINSEWNLSFIGGKMENPFVFSDTVFDPDYTPEGLAQQISYTLNGKHAIKLNLGEFVLDEVAASSSDPLLFGAQLRFDSQWSPKWQTAFGVAGLGITGRKFLTTASVPDQNLGNTRGTNGALVYSYYPIVADASVTYSLPSLRYYAGPFPIRVGGTYVFNPGAPRQNTAYEAGVAFGKAGKKGTWEIAYRWKTLEADSWYEELVDSDTGAFYQTAAVGGRSGYGPGTNLRGHWMRVAYSPYDSLTLAATYYLFELINESPAGSGNQTGRLQVDAMWRF